MSLPIITVEPYLDEFRAYISSVDGALTVRYAQTACEAYEACLAAWEATQRPPAKRYLVVGKRTGRVYLVRGRIENEVLIPETVPELLHGPDFMPPPTRFGLAHGAFEAVELP